MFRISPAKLLSKQLKTFDSYTFLCTKSLTSRICSKLFVSVRFSHVVTSVSLWFCVTFFGTLKENSCRSPYFTFSFVLH